MSQRIPGVKEFSILKTKKRKKHKPSGIVLVRLALRIFSRLSPTLASFYAYHLWFKTRRFAQPDREKLWLRNAQTANLPFKSGTVSYNSWGSGPTILLIHGWNARGAQLGGFVEPLVKLGFKVVAFDAPAHGKSTGSKTNVYEVSDALFKITALLGPIEGIIAHSFGTIVSTHAIKNGLQAKWSVCISAPAQVTLLIDYFCLALAIPTTVKNKLISRIEHVYGRDVWTQISTAENARHLRLPALIVHDEYDNDVPLEQGRLLHDAWQNSELHITQRLGHRRILRDPANINHIVTFIQKQQITKPMHSTSTSYD